MAVRPDQSDYLGHFTKKSESSSAYDNLIKILIDKKINAFSLKHIGRKAVCFTECPWTSLIRHADHYSPYAIGFNKPLIYAAGGGPVFYVRPDLWDKQHFEDDVKTFTTPFKPGYRPKKQREADPEILDYTHEREWRVPHDFTFNYDDIEFIIVNTYEDMAKFPRELKDAIGRDKFLILEIYMNIEKLWPVHKI